MIPLTKLSTDMAMTFHGQDLWQICPFLSGNQQMEQSALKNVNNYLNINIYSYLETNGCQSSNLYLNVIHFFNH
jgi:hypothetical protein